MLECGGASQNSSDASPHRQALQRPRIYFRVEARRLPCARLRRRGKVPTGQSEQQLVQILRIVEGIIGQASSSKRDLGRRDYLYRQKRHQPIQSPFLPTGHASFLCIRFAMAQSREFTQSSAHRPERTIAGINREKQAGTNHLRSTRRTRG